MGTAVWILGRELLLLRALRILPPMPLAEVTRVRLRPLANFHAKVALDWTLGALLFFILFATTPDLFAVAIVTGLSIVAAIVLVYPQVALGRITLQAHERACNLAANEMRRLYAESQEGRCETPGDSWQFVENLSNLITITARPKFWVYSFDELLRWTLAQGLVITGLLYQATAGGAT